MAIDQALLDSAGQPGAGMTLRLYQWGPPTLSLGYFQAAEARLGHRPSSTIDLVRRTTGGGAIVHHHELTYSLALPLEDRWSEQHRQLYGRLHDVILEALEAWQIRAGRWRSASGPAVPAPRPEFLCFLRRNEGDLVLGGYKVCGSAQRRSERALLQHGSILLARSVHAPELPGIGEISGIAVGAEELGDRLIACFSKAFGAGAVAGGLSEGEAAAAREWQVSRFGSSCWTGRR